MKFYLKEKLTFLYAKGEIFDENEEVAYTFKNETLFLPKITLMDRYGEEIGRVEKQFTLFLREYQIYLYDRYIDSIKQQFTFFRHELDFEKIGWKIEGDFLAWNYQIINDNDEIVADVHEEIFHFTKQYSIEVYDERNADLAILIVLAINQFDKDNDAAQASASSSHSSNN